MVLSVGSEFCFPFFFHHPGNACLLQPSHPVLRTVDNISIQMSDFHTPTKSHALDGVVDSPVLSIKYRDLNSAIEAIKLLETELSEFQTSSYELEKELEQELDSLERENIKLQGDVKKAESELSTSREEFVRYKQQSENEKLVFKARIKELEEELNRRQRQLVEKDIQNENIQQTERNLQSDYDELLEKFESCEERAVLLENDLVDVKEQLSKEILSHQNTKNELTELKNNASQVTKDVKQSQTTSSRTMYRSNSLRQLHTILSQTHNMEHKLENIKRSLHSGNAQRKTSATTGITNVGVLLSTTGSFKEDQITTRGGQRVRTVSMPTSTVLSSESSQSRKRIPNSPSSTALSSLAGRLSSSLGTIEGSPNKDRI